MRSALVLSLLPLSSLAISQDEELSYVSIKSNYNDLDKELNDLYKSQIQEYKKEGGMFYGQSESRDIFLKKSQQVWIEMRDASCDYETYESRAGTGFSGIYTKCLLDKTNERIKYLKENN